MDIPEKAGDIDQLIKIREDAFPKQHIPIDNWTNVYYTASPSTAMCYTASSLNTTKPV